MAKPELVIGNKNYSSWSLRPWMALKMAGVPFTEVFVRIMVPETPKALAKYKATGKVPLLAHNGLVIWDSLAIVEYAAETWPTKPVWPKNKKARARARSVAAEMHSGFSALRTACPMNLRRAKKPPPGGISEAVAKDVTRIEQIWAECRKSFGKGGPFLFGRFSAADAFFAPVATRLDTFAIPVSKTSRAYMEALFATPAFQQWKADALKETWVIPEDEVD